MIKVALTGNIGSGKTTVARIFEVLDVPVFYADLVAKDLYNDVVVINEVSDKISSDVIVDNQVDKKRLADVIFSSKKYLDIINEIIHPRVYDAYKLWCKQNEDSNYTIHEAAVIFENNIQHRFDKVIVVTAPEDIRINRVLNRDLSDVPSIKKRIGNQMDEQQKVKLADFVINNDGNTFIIPQVLAIHKLFNA